MKFEWDENKNDSNVKRHGIDFQDAKNILSKSRTDLKRLANMKDADIDLSDIPEIPPEKFAKAIVRKGLKSVLKKSQVTLRIDADVLQWFKETGKGYQTRINSLLRIYMEENENARRRRGA